MVSSKYLLTAFKGKGGSSSRTVSEAVSPGKETKRQTASPDRLKEVAVVPTPEKSKEGRMKRKHDSPTQQKEAKKKKIAEEVEDQQTAEELPERQETANTAIVSSSARTNAFMARCPSSSDLKLLAISPSTCVEEKKWLASLPADALHYETSKYFEMARLGYHATATYCGVLEAKCRSLERTPMQQSQLTMAQELVRKVKTERDQLQKEKEELVKTLEAKERVIEENGKKLSGKNKNLKTAEKLLKDFKEKVQALLAESKTKEREWGEEKQVLTQRVLEGEKKLRDIYKSEEFKIKVGGSILPHWQQGIHIGVRQAVKTFGGLDPRIAYFEPDYQDVCGEPYIEDSDEEVESKEGDDPSKINEAMDED